MDDLAQTFKVARFLVLEQSPWLGEALFRLRPTVDVNAQAPYLDRTDTVHIPPGTQADTLADSLVHIVWHRLLLHGRRMADFEYREIASLASCLECNGSFHLLGRYVEPHPQEYGLPDDLLSEAYYKELLDMGDEVSLDGSCGTTEHVADVGDENQQRQWEAVATNAAAAISREPGNTPEGEKRWAQEHLGTATVPWQQVLAGWLTDVLGHGGTTRRDTWSRPSRRPALDDLRLRGTEKLSTCIGVVIDTSGSMSREALREVLSELHGMVTAHAIRTVAVACDTEATEPTLIQTATDIETFDLVGGGGTDLTGGIAKLTTYSEFTERLNGIIMMTDGYLDWPPAMSLPMAALLVGEDQATDDIPSHILPITPGT